METLTTDVSQLISKARAYLPEEKLGLVEDAFAFASQCHDGQERMSGVPYIEHPIQTALELAELRLDADSLAAGLLHDVIEDCGVTVEQLTERFGPEVAKLVDGVTKLTRMDLARLGRLEKTVGSSTEGHLQAESLRKMLVAMAEDIRVVLIKLADRLHNMRTLSALPPRRRRVIAQETLEIYAPLAHRLGIWDIKWQLEDLAFRHMEPGKYRTISRMLAVKREEREEYVARVAGLLSRELEKAGIKAEVYGRPKHIFSIYQKMEKYSQQGKELSQIYDLYALRVLTNTKADCYNALGVAHNLWRPLPGQFDDYIASPKENLYQALHTAVMTEGGVPLEVQIRAYDMHQIAEYGVAAHWRYKEGGLPDMKFEEKMTWLRQLLDWQRDVSAAEEFVESVKTDIFQDQVFVYTPKGDIKELPAGATSLDFAFHIHTELGFRCVGGKVNGKLVSLDTRLNNGDTVEILASKAPRGPSLDWLNPDLGYLNTAGAREKVRQWFRKQERTANVQRGRDLLHKELKRLNMAQDEATVAKLFKHEVVEDFMAALGSGAVTINQVVAKLAPPAEKPAGIAKQIVRVSGPSSGIQVLGVGDLLTRLAQCCEPIPGDDIVGFITRSRGVTVHKRDCLNILNEDEQERMVPVTWGKTQTLFPVRLDIAAWDRVGLLRDITTIVSEDGVNIASAVTREHPNATATVSLTLFVQGLPQLSRLFAKLEGVRGVNSVVRSTSTDGFQVSPD